MDACPTTPGTHTSNQYPSTSTKLGGPQQGVTVIVGAGVSGLSTALDLAERGCECVVLEARDRVGGRVLTTRLANGNVVDLGAAFIHGTSWSHNPVYRWALEENIPMDATHGGYSAG